MKEFPTNYEAILQRIENINPIKYGKTRNYIDGDVTYLSPYISRGVISTKQVLNSVLKRGYKLKEINSFVQELCWRDYFQRVWQHKDINLDIRTSQPNYIHKKIPASIIDGTTSINVIDKSINSLYETGYMHNHHRMYVASIVCNIGKSYWYHPAQWMYYHLLDGDWASNACSWQWVSGANSGKKYFANQENINKFSKNNQRFTFIDRSYEELEKLDIPLVLSECISLELKTNLCQIPNKITIDEKKPTLIYNYYNLDNTWHSGEDVNRILLIEPKIFEKYPVSDKCISFMLSLAKNIEGLQVFLGSFDEMVSLYDINNVVFKEHPLNRHYKGKAEPRDWICKEVTEFYPSFFSYWKKVERNLGKKF
jgi:deoxyribodipyrimidine photo-lyase